VSKITTLLAQSKLAAHIAQLFTPYIAELMVLAALMMGAIR
jgi:hypothetical protein